MSVFLYDEFGVIVPPPTIKRTLVGAKNNPSKGRTEPQVPNLLDFYFHRLSDFCSYQLVYVDESGCDNVKGNLGNC